MPLKIAMIGAGAVGWTRRLMHDLLKVPEFADLHYALTDISEQNLSMAYQLCEKDVKANGLPTKISQTMDRRAATKDADYVICAIRQGGLEAFKTDIDIPLKYGIDQCVGDTICAGGIMYAQRTINALLEFCRDIREVAKPHNGSVKAAAKRLSDHERAGTRVRTVETQGVARIQTKTVAEMQKNKEEHRAMAAASDKGKMTKV